MESTQEQILNEISGILKEGGKTYDMIPKIRKALSKDEEYKSKLQSIYEEVNKIDTNGFLQRSRAGKAMVKDKVLNIIRKYQ